MPPSDKDQPSDKPEQEELALDAEGEPDAPEHKPEPPAEEEPEREQHFEEFVDDSEWDDPYEDESEEPDEPKTTTPKPDPYSDDEPPEEPQPGEMSFMDHLEDLRWTVLRALLILIASCVLVGFFMGQFMDVLQWPLEQALGERAEEILVSRAPFSVISVIFQVVFLGGFALALPGIFGCIAYFVAPGLTDKEKRVIIPGIVTATLLFLAGASFSYFFLVPSALKVSAAMNASFGFGLLWSPETYYGLLVWMVIGVGLSFEFPLLLIILIYVELITIAQCKAFRPYSVVAFLVIAAVVTPTADPITFLFLAGPMYILYEASILVAGAIMRKKREDALAG